VHTTNDMNEYPWGYHNKETTDDDPQEDHYHEHRN